MFKNYKLNNPYRLLSNPGFTLVEILIAVSVISIALVSVHRMYAQSISMNHNIRFYITASLLAQKKMAELEMEDLEDIVSDRGDFEEEFSNYSWEVVLDDVESEYFEKIADDIKKIDIIISYNDEEYKMNISAYKFIR